MLLGHSRAPLRLNAGHEDTICYLLNMSILIEQIQSCVCIFTVRHCTLSATGKLLRRLHRPRRIWLVLSLRWSSLLSLHIVDVPDIDPDPRFLGDLYFTAISTNLLRSCLTFAFTLHSSANPPRYTLEHSSKRILGRDAVICYSYYGDISALSLPVVLQ